MSADESYYTLRTSIRKAADKNPFMVMGIYAQDLEVLLTKIDAMQEQIRVAQENIMLIRAGWR